MYYIIMFWDYGWKFFKYFVEDRKTFSKYFILSFVVGLLELFGVALTFPFINRLLSEGKINLMTIFFGIFIILAFLTKNIIMILYNRLQAEFTKSCEAKINRKFFNYFLNGNYDSIVKIPYVKKIQIMNFLTPSVINNFLVRVLNLNVNIFVFVLIMSFLFAKFFVATCITLVCSLILLVSQAYFFKIKTAKVSKLISKANEYMNKSITESLLNIKSVKILNGETYFFDKYLQKQEKYRLLARDLLFYNSIPAFVTEPFIIIILLILLSIISIQNIESPNTLVASYAVIVSAIFRLAPTISRIQVNLTGINTSLPQVKELVGFYEDIDLQNFVVTQKELSNFTHTFELKNAYFSYDDKLALENVNIKINKGDFIGIAGSSGAGKTTLIDIISGLLKLKSGEVIVDGMTLEGNNIPKFKIGYIPQDYGIVTASIRENVAFGLMEIDDNKVVEALKQAQLYDFIIENYKEGIYAEPFVDSKGFSQGQKQRLAIARALYINPDIIILDEATSSLDLKTEDEICKVLNSLKGEKTIIAIAHRLSTIKNADFIYVMGNATITDSGSFEELYARNSEFKELVDLNNTNPIH